eukprot:jgi/Hompol1/4169/HPOL_006963-RA
MLHKELEDQCRRLDRDLQILVKSSEQQIKGFQEKLNTTIKEQEMEKRRHHETAEQLAEKSRQFQKLQVMYDKLKRKTMMMPQRKDDASLAGQSQMPSQNGHAMALGYGYQVS